MKRGYFGIGIYHPKHEQNVGTLFRSAWTFGADFIFTIGPRYRRQASDTPNAQMHIPLHHFVTVQDMIDHLPNGCPLFAVEQTENSISLDKFSHPVRCAYLLGAEDHGLPGAVLERCHHVIEIPHVQMCLNVAVAGSIILYDRVTKHGTPTVSMQSGRYSPSRPCPATCAR